MRHKLRDRTRSRRERLTKSFEKYYPDLEAKLKELPPPEQELPHRKMDDKVDEILLLVRQLSRLGPDHPSSRDTSPRDVRALNKVREEVYSLARIYADLRAANAFQPEIAAQVVGPSRTTHSGFTFAGGQQSAREARHGPRPADPPED